METDRNVGKLIVTSFAVGALWQAASYRWIRFVRCRRWALEDGWR